jgi:Fe-S cluster biogenesis protein NfuA
MAVEDLSAKVEKLSTQEFQKQLGRVEELIAALENVPDPKVAGQIRELIQTLLELHGSGLERILGVVYAGAEGPSAIDELGQDRLVSGLLLLHGLHPLDLETRVRRAIEEVKPRLGQHGGSVELVEVTAEGAVRIKLEGNCHGCPSSRVTLHSTIEEELYAAAPDITSLEVDGAVEPLAAIAANPAPAFTACPLPDGSEVKTAAAGGGTL